MSAYLSRYCVKTNRKFVNHRVFYGLNKYYQTITTNHNFKKRFSNFECFNRAGYLTCSKVKSIDEQLMLFPEYQLLKSYSEVGKFDLMIPLLYRIHDVISNSMGADSPIANEIIYNIAIVHRYQGKYNKAIDLISSNSDNLKLSIIYKSKFLQLKSLCCILEANYNEGSKYAEDAIAISEQQTNYDHDITMFSSSYESYGINHLLNNNNDLDLAETYLQLAARWAQTPFDQMIAFNNLGLLSICRLSKSDIVSESHPLAHGLFSLRRSNRLSISSSSLKTMEWRNEIETNKLIQEAFEYWTSALNIVVTSENTSKNNDNISAMCGIPSTTTTTNGSINNSNINNSNNSSINDMTGLGSDAISIPNATSLQSTTNDNNNHVMKNNCLESFIKDDIQLMIAYVNILCNFAEIYQISGNIIKAQEYISSALTTIQSISQQQELQHGETEVVHYPVLGRVLGLAAYAELSMGQLVVAEGLFISAIEKLSSPYAINDARYQYEKALVIGNYGLLLTKWGEKRVKKGEEMMNEANTIIHELNKTHKQLDILSTFIQFNH